MKKTLLIVTAIFTLFLTLFFFTKPTASFTAGNSTPVANNNHAHIGERFAGEEFVYKVAFWVFTDVAVGSIGIRKGENGEYIATLKAQTTGFVDRLFFHREDVYTATLKVVDNGKRFMTTRFEKSILSGEKKTRTLTEIDYKTGAISMKAWKDDKLRKSNEIKIPKGVTYDDPLAAFYNFRFGAYGPVKEGGEYHILTLPKEQNPEIKIDIWMAPKKDFVEYSNGKDPRARYFSKFHLDKELFDSASGVIEILFNENLVPVVAVAKDILMLGDVTGTLLETNSGDYEKYL